MDRDGKQENEEKTSQEEDSDFENGSEKYFAPEFKPTYSNSITSIRSRSIHSIGEQLAAVEVKRPRASTPPVAMEIHSHVKTEESMVTLPDEKFINTADSFTTLKKMAEKVCPESAEG